MPAAHCEKDEEEEEAVEEGQGGDFAGGGGGGVLLFGVRRRGARGKVFGKGVGHWGGMNSVLWHFGRYPSRF